MLPSSTKKWNTECIYGIFFPAAYRTDPIVYATPPPINSSIPETGHNSNKTFKNANAPQPNNKLHTTDTTWNLSTFIALKVTPIAVIVHITANRNHPKTSSY